MRPTLIARHRILHVQKHWAHIRHTRACSFIVENTGLSINLSHPVFSRACGAMRYTFKRSVRDGEIELEEIQRITLEVSQEESGREPNAVRSLTLNFGHTQRSLRDGIHNYRNFAFEWISTCYSAIHLIAFVKSISGTVQVYGRALISRSSRWRIGVTFA